uniref:Uncharacterized protein n=1 Tax=Pyropia yezoensis TaxID=2788 RepID=I0B729_PYRYE|nr:hypothetical protein PyyeM_p23 [Neopyropia yezoensis]AFH57697.1 hypothetical protein [Neopyropia yezoensis]QGA30562.1 hypothetical protein PyyeMp23 [Neopyropia yezoensis]BAS69685.1 hypothetical protein [Neopyropia yezoensis]
MQVVLKKLCFWFIEYCNRIKKRQKCCMICEKRLLKFNLMYATCENICVKLFVL